MPHAEIWVGIFRNARCQVDLRGVDEKISITKNRMTLTVPRECKLADSGLRFSVVGTTKLHSLQGVYTRLQNR